MKPLVLFALFLILPLSLPAAKHKKAATVQKPAAIQGKSHKIAAPARTTKRVVQTNSRRHSSRSARKHPVATVAAPPRQAAPTNDRYREIQEALAAKGYLAGPPTGTWDQNSQDAMRRFQTDQNLSSSGKLTSRSIIALGLGSPSSAKPSEPAESPKQ